MVSSGGDRAECRYRGLRWVGTMLSTGGLMSATKIVDSKRDRSPGRHKAPGSLVALEVVLGLLAIGAAQGGIAMIRDPYTPLGLTTA